MIFNACFVILVTALPNLQIENLFTSVIMTSETFGPVHHAHQDLRVVAKLLCDRLRENTSIYDVGP